MAAVVEDNKIRTELVFIPTPAVGHLVSAVEMAKQLVDRHDRLSITILIMEDPFGHLKTSTFAASLLPSNSKHAELIRFVDIPPPPARNADDFPVNTHSSPASFLSHFVHAHIPQFRAAVSQLLLPAAIDGSSSSLGGLVLDMFLVPMVDIADELGVPSYVFFTSGAAFLGLLLHFQLLHDRDNRDITELKKDWDSAESPDGDELIVPAFAKPFPAKLMPGLFLDEHGGSEFAVNIARRMRSTKGILVNTFEALESHAIGSLLHQQPLPPIYPVGPVINLGGGREQQTKDSDDVLEWLDGQPERSVVFLCFGSGGSFPAEQVKEIATGLELSGHRFLWSLRRPQPPDKFGLPGSHTVPEELLPEGFLERTAGTGKVIGWAPQVAVLSHAAVGGFVSHCGWNSTLESVWCGVPVATWPLYAEQQMNAFLMAEEAGLAVGLTLEYRKDFKGSTNMVLGAGEVEKGIRRVMGRESEELRGRFQEMSFKARKAVEEGGTSFAALGSFIDNVMHNIAA